MTNYWIFNSAYADTKFRKNSGGLRQHAKIEIESKKRGLMIQRNTNFLLMGSSDGTNEYSFSHYGKVMSVSDGVELPFSDKDLEVNEERRRKNLSPLSKSFKYTVSVNPQGELVTNNRLGDLAYSLQAVGLYAKPFRHFQKQYRTIEEFDYETVVAGHLYIARTAFGKIANALPRANRMEFTILSMEKFGSEDLIGIDYLQALDFLFDYVERKILNPGTFVIETDALLEKVFENKNVPYQRIGFLDSDEAVPDSIREQANIFRELFDQGGSKDLLAEIKDGVFENANIEKRFSSVFNKSRWPVYLGPQYGLAKQN